MTFSVAITVRVRRRKTPSGRVLENRRHVVNYRDPHTGARRQEFFERAKEALARKNELVVKIGTGTFVNERTVPTVAEAVEHWLEDKATRVKANTLAGYRIVLVHIIGPRLVGTPEEQREFKLTGKKPRDARVYPMLGPTKLNELATADLRVWNRQVKELAGAYTAARAMSHLRSILSLAEEDYGVRAVSMPKGLRRARARPKKAILTSSQIATLLSAATRDTEHGVYYAFPFLAGTRPSEQLGLLWDDVDFAKGVIRISRIQERTGELTSLTKTEAGTRDIPMGPVLREMMSEWRLRCPRKDNELHRVFPGPGRLQPWPKLRVGGGGPLLYQNFRKRYWAPAFKALGLPYVTPHSARHSWISTMQSVGIEVGLVAKLAGHANATVTLGHYTQAVRGGEGAIAALERAYSG